MSVQMIGQLKGWSLLAMVKAKCYLKVHDVHLKHYQLRNKKVFPVLISLNSKAKILSGVLTLPRDTFSMKLIYYIWVCLLPWASLNRYLPRRINNIFWKHIYTFNWIDFTYCYLRCLKHNFEGAVDLWSFKGQKFVQVKQQFGFWLKRQI